MLYSKGGNHGLKFRNIDDYCCVLSKTWYWYKIVDKLLGIWCSVCSWYNALRWKFLDKKGILEQS